MKNRHSSHGILKNWVKAATNFAAIAVGLISATANADNANVAIRWGVLPFYDAPADGTVFLAADETPQDVGAFNAQYRMRLAFVGDGMFDETRGFSLFRWASDPIAATSAYTLYGASALADFSVDIETFLPVDWIGDIDELDPEGEIYEDYGDIWHSFYWTILVQEPESRRVWRISETPGGSAFASLKSIPDDIEIIENTDQLILYPDANQFSMILSTESKKVFIGAEIPQRCVWMAEKGISEEDLAGYDEKTVKLAMALGKMPEEVAGGVKLKIEASAFGTSGNTISWSFTATDSAGNTDPVEKLYGGATLYLEKATSPDALGTANAIREELDPSAGSATLSTAASAGFTRLVLDIP